MRSVFLECEADSFSLKTDENGTLQNFRLVQRAVAWSSRSRVPTKNRSWQTDLRVKKVMGFKHVLISLVHVSDTCTVLCCHQLLPPPLSGFTYFCPTSNDGRTTSVPFHIRWKQKLNCLLKFIATFSSTVRRTLWELALRLSVIRQSAAIGSNHNNHCTPLLGQSNARYTINPSAADVVVTASACCQCSRSPTHQTGTFWPFTSTRCLNHQSFLWLLRF